MIDATIAEEIVIRGPSIMRLAGVYVAGGEVVAPLDADTSPALRYC